MDQMNVDVAHQVGLLHAGSSDQRLRPSVMQIEPTHEKYIEELHHHPQGSSHSTITDLEYSASELAYVSAALWESIVAPSLHCNLAVTIVRPVQLLEDFQVETKYPRHLEDKEFLKSVEAKDKKRARYVNVLCDTSFRVWMKSLPGSWFAKKKDPHELKQYRHALYVCWDSHVRAAERLTNESNVRWGVDGLTKIAFSLRTSGRHGYELERFLYLPNKPQLARANAITWIQMPYDWANFLVSGERQLLSFIYASVDQDPSLLVTFAREDKASSADACTAARQIAIDLCSMQFQRRALGFNDGLAFGSTLVGSNLRIYAAEWGGDTVHVNPTTVAFDLTTFEQFLRCYIFFCKLADYIADEVDAVFRKWKSPEGKLYLQRKANEAMLKPWRIRKKEVPLHGGMCRKARDERAQEEDDSQYAYDWEESEEEWEIDVPRVSNADDREPAPSGSSALSEVNLRAFNAHRAPEPATHASFAMAVQEWVRQSAVGHGATP